MGRLLMVCIKLDDGAWETSLVFAGREGMHRGLHERVSLGPRSRVVGVSGDFGAELVLSLPFRRRFQARDLSRGRLMLGTKELRVRRIDGPKSGRSHDVMSGLGNRSIVMGSIFWGSGKKRPWVLPGASCILIGMPICSKRSRNSPRAERHLSGCWCTRRPQGQCPVSLVECLMVLHVTRWTR